VTRPVKKLHKLQNEVKEYDVMGVVVVDTPSRDHSDIQP
jgi:hypothetical protein